jgi:hypothetical protein
MAQGMAQEMAGPATGHRPIQARTAITADMVQTMAATVAATAEGMAAAEGMAGVTRTARHSACAGSR